jgi:hypothetical protein
VRWCWAFSALIFGLFRNHYSADLQRLHV